MMMIVYAYTRHIIVLVLDTSMLIWLAIGITRFYYQLM